MNRHLLAGAACAAATVLWGCVGLPQQTAREQPLAPDALGLEGPAYVAPEAGWWQGLGDPQLDRMMLQALALNPGLGTALARVRSAQAQAQAAGAASAPQLRLDAEAYRERVSEHYIYPPPFAGGTFWEGRLGLSLGWNLDFWGRQASLLEQAQHVAGAAALDAVGTRLLLSSAVAQSYVELARAAQLEVLAADVAQQRARLAELTRQRVQAGLDTDVERLGAESGVARIAVDREQARLAQATARHALAALTGRGADAYATLEPPGLDFERALPLPGTLPADLLAHRPDVAAARLRVAAAESGRQAAAANFYPNVNLAAFLGLEAIGLDQLLDSESHTWSVGPALHLPLFDAGRLRADYRRAGADADAAIAAYNETVLRAVREAADQVARLDSLDRQLADQQRLLDTAAAAYRLAEQRYGAGLANYLTVLNAESQVFDARRQRLNLLADRTLARIALLVALGGDFQETNP